MLGGQQRASHDAPAVNVHPSANPGDLFPGRFFMAMEVGWLWGRWGGWGVGQVAATGRELQLMRMEDLKPSQHYNLLQLRISSSLNPPNNRKVMYHYSVRIYFW